MNLNIGTLEGEVLVFGGPYSNLHALKALKKEASVRRIMPSNIICTGDIVGYCAYPDESVKFIEEWGIHCIAGNVEFNLREEADDCGCNFDEGSRCDLLSKQWFPYAKENISPASLEYLDALPEFINFKYNGQDGIVLHGSYENTSEFIFKSTPWKTKLLNFRQSDTELILSGHSGIPFLETDDINTWLNAGVIGMPANDGSARTWFAIMHNDKIEFHQLDYDNEAAALAMKTRPLPKSYAQTLVDGIWDNCDILPETETLAQGKSLF